MARRVLIVDDDKEIVERRAKLLRNRGYEVDCAFNGRQGLKILKNGSIQCRISINFWATKNDIHLMDESVSFRNET